MFSRREALAAIGTGIVGSTAGCLDAVPFVGGPMTFEAAVSTVPEAVLAETGYEEQGRDELVIERTVEAGGQTQAVVVTNQQVEYDKGVDLGAAGLPVDQRVRAAICTVLTTPQVEVLGRSFNPVADMDSADLAETVQGRYEGMEGLERVGEETAPVAGQSTTVGAFEGEADLVEAGVAVDVTLHISEAVEAGDDLIVAVAGYPTVLADQEAPHAFAMLDGIEHSG